MQKRVNVNFPAWMVESLDREASKLGLTRQSVIKVWLAERLERSASQRSDLTKASDAGQEAMGLPLLDKAMGT